MEVWNLTNCKICNTLTRHSGYVNMVAVLPDGSLCASGGKDEKIKVIKCHTPNSGL